MDFGWSMDNSRGTSSIPLICFTFSFIVFVIFLSFSFLAFNNPIFIKCSGK